MQDSGVRDSVFRRHPLATGIAAGIVAVVLVSGLTAWGVGTAVTASLTSENAPMTPLSTPTAAPVQGGRLADGRVAMRATIESIGDSSWTVTTMKGQSITITIDSATRFGTRKMTESASSFAAGDSVIIVATRTGSSATAIRIVNASALRGRLGAGNGSTPITPTPAPTSSTTT